MQNAKTTPNKAPFFIQAYFEIGVPSVYMTKRYLKTGTF